MPCFGLSYGHVTLRLESDEKTCGHVNISLLNYEIVGSAALSSCEFLVHRQAVEQSLFFLFIFFKADAD